MHAKRAHGNKSQGIYNLHRTAYNKANNSNTVFARWINADYEWVESDAMEAMCKLDISTGCMPGSSVELEQCQTNGTIIP
jgi:hypothetical protein